MFKYLFGSLMRLFTLPKRLFGAQKRDLRQGTPMGGYRELFFQQVFQESIQFFIESFQQFLIE